MKKLSISAIIILLLILTICLVACTGGSGLNTDDSNLSEFTGITFSDITVNYDGNEHSILCDGVPEGATVTYSNNTATDDGEYSASATISKEGYKTLTLNAKLKIILTSQRIVDAITSSAETTQQNYDFRVNLAGTVNIGGFSGTANANYDGKYRFNSENNSLSFWRETSGALLYDSIEYIYNTGSNKVKVVVNPSGEVKKTAVVPKEDEDLNLINIPFTAIINHTDENNIFGITKSGNGYQYKAKLAIASDNVYISKIISLLGKLGTSIDIGDVSFSNPANGIDLYFNLNADKSKFADYKFSAEVTFPVKGVPITLTLTYEQKASNSTIKLPSVSGLITDTTEISNEISVINSALGELKNSDTYSLDLEAVNEFDPGWKVRATVDKYFSRLYKNINNDRVDFNQSFEYKSHSETDGAETYKYTYGNIQDGTVHLVSRKGSNTITQANGVTVDTQFDYMVNAALVNANNIDCIKKSTKDASIIYNIYLKKAETLTINNKITALINSNPAPEVVYVENYFNANNYTIKDAALSVEMKNGKIVSIKIDTDIRYCPTGGDYTEMQINLVNSIILTVNAELDKAQEYCAPEKTNTTNPLKPGLNNAKYYIR